MLKCTSNTLIVGAILLLSCKINGQTISGYVPSSNIFHYSDFLTYINPAGAILVDSKILVNTKVAGYTGIRKSISEYYADAWMNFTSRQKVSAGVQFYNNNQGPYIQLINAKCIGRYAVYLKNQSRINAGLGFGFLNYAFEGSEYFGGGSDLVPDLDAGLSWQSERWNVGLSALQLIDQKLVPLSGIISKRNTFNVHASRKIPLNATLDVTPFARVYYDVGDKQWNSTLTAELLFHRYYKIIVLMHEQRNAGLGLALHQLPTPAGELGLNFMAAYPVLRNNGVTSGRYEIGVSYRWKRTTVADP